MNTELKRREVVTAFLRHNGKILIVRRSRRVGSYQGRWSGISGYLEDPTALLQVKREIREETGLMEEQIFLVVEADPLEIPAPEMGTCWVVHPFLFDIGNPEDIKLDWENVEFLWIDPGELPNFSTVPALDRALETCLRQESNRHE